jgi:hypothetical protein
MFLFNYHNTQYLQMQGDQQYFPTVSNDNYDYNSYNEYRQQEYFPSSDGSYQPNEQQTYQQTNEQQQSYQQPNDQQQQQQQQEYNYTDNNYQQDTSYHAENQLTYEQQQEQLHSQYYQDEQSQLQQQQLQLQQQIQQQQEKKQPDHVTVDDLLTHAASIKQRQQNSKRFRASQIEETDRKQSSYLQQKNENEARAGNRGEESGKWLVR